MSVINTMLKDLERRGVQSEDSSDNILGGLTANQTSDDDDNLPRNVYMISFLGLVAIVVLVVGIYSISPYQLVVAQAQSPELSPNNPGPADVEPQAAMLNKEAAVESRSPAEPVVTTKTAKRTAAAQVKPKKQVQAATRVKAAARAREKIIASPVENLAEESDELNDSQASLRVVSKQQRDFTPEEKSRQAYGSAQTLYNQGNKQAAKNLLIEALDYSANNADAHRLLAVIYLEDGRLDVATEVLEKALTTHANDQTLLRLYLQALVQGEKYPEAIAVMELRLKLTTPDDLGYLAGLYQKNNDHLNAIKLYAQALKLIPSKSIWWMGQGISFEVMQQYSEALKSYQQSISTGQLSGQLTEYALSRVNLIMQHKAGSVS